MTKNNDDYFEKSDERPGRISHEATGLRWLAEANAEGGAPVVRVYEWGKTWLREERLKTTSPSSQAAGEFGRRLAHTHAAGAPHFGAPPPGHHGDSYMGNTLLPLPATKKLSSSSWGEFYAHLRIEPYLHTRAFTPEERSLISAFCEKLSSGVYDAPQPALVTQNGHSAARIHGDLWNGNVVWAQGGATLIDSAAQGGHAEEDLAVLHIFGCPYLEHIIRGYNDESPLAQGWAERLPLHQLHILMVHCDLFGRAYVGDVMRIIRRFL